MNEASSKYVDQIAMEKLLREKLSRVHHAPVLQPAPPRGLAAGETAAEPGELRADVQSSPGEIRFRSAVGTPYAENDTVICRCRPAARPVGAVLFVHGLYEDNPDIYRFLFSLLNDGGLDVWSLVLPYHYERTPAGSLFSGEYFWSADLVRSVEAYRQAVSDSARAYDYLAEQGRPLCLVGFSMGGGVALTLAARRPLAGVFAVNPVCNIAQEVWTSRLFAPVRDGLLAQSVTRPHVAAAFRPYEPLLADPVRTPRERIGLAHGIYDQINDPANYARLAETWRLDRVHSYKAGHLNILRAPRLATDIIGFMLEDAHELH